MISSITLLLMELLLELLHTSDTELEEKLVEILLSLLLNKMELVLENLLSLKDVLLMELVEELLVTLKLDVKELVDVVLELLLELTVNKLQVTNVLEYVLTAINSTLECSLENKEDTDNLDKLVPIHRSALPERSVYWDMERTGGGTRRVSNVVRIPVLFLVPLSRLVAPHKPTEYLWSTCTMSLPVARLPLHVHRCLQCV